jgi:hypothetical protein
MQSIELKGGQSSIKMIRWVTIGECCKVEAQIQGVFKLHDKCGGSAMTMVKAAVVMINDMGGTWADQFEDVAISAVPNSATRRCTGESRPAPLDFVALLLEKKFYPACEFIARHCRSAKLCGGRWCAAGLCGEHAPPMITRH